MGISNSTSIYLSRIFDSLLKYLGALRVGIMISFEMKL